ncbi:M56 family metallopeptidase [Armatimonas sp.]|uniref:M56 family metallopeptidase n=1 Tax=Armatimonas sp. TaxID=1872638 RepID=UPI00286B6B7A|nr:M56 family metallopeptidase [Armatimonas sp.]
MNLTNLDELATLWSEGMLRACWQGALAVGIVWCLCRLFPRLPAATRALLWWLVCLKALLSLVTTGPLKLAVLPAAPAPSSPTVVLTPVAVQSVSVRALPQFSQTAPRSPIPPAPPALSAHLSVSSALFTLWLTGVLALLALVSRERRTVRQLAAQARPCEEATPLREVARAVGLASSPPILVSERTKSSLVMGLWRPKVVLCQADMIRLTQSELRAVLAHELAHIRRKDLLAGTLPNLARLVFFFDPFVWLACREYDLAREAACDAEALRVSGMAPAEYGRLLLKLSLPSPPLTPTAGMVTLGVASPDGLLLRRRLQGLRRGTGLPRGASSLALLATLGAFSLHPTRGSARIAAVRSEPPLAAPPAAKAPIQPLSPVVPAGQPAITLPNLVITKGIDTMFTPPTQPKPLMRPLGLKSKLSTALATASLSLVATPLLLTPAPVAAQVQIPPPAPAIPQIPAIPAVPAVPFVPVVPSVPAVPEGQASRYQYTLRMGTSYSVHSQDSKVATAQRELAKAQPGDCLVVDRDGKRYLITDPETLRKLQDNYASLEVLGKQMEAKGKEMELMSKPMEEFAKQMEAFGKQMEEKGKEMEALGKQMESASEAERQGILEKIRALQQQMKAPAEEMRQLGKKMRESGDKRRQPGSEMRELGQKMRVAAKEANERMMSTIDTSFKNNLAVEQKGS